MINFARPTAAEERWLAVASELGDRLPPAEIAARAGGWRSTGLLARIALFFLGLLAAALIGGIMSFGGTTTLLFSGLIAAFAAESLARGKRLFASGIEEGLCLGGWLLLGGWAATLFGSVGVYADHFYVPVLIVAAAAAGLRLLNPFITTMAAIAFVRWAGWNVAEWPVFRALGAGLPTLVIGGTIALLALWLGGRHWQRPSHDRMLDWLVAALPITSYSGAAAWAALDPNVCVQLRGRPLAHVAAASHARRHDGDRRSASVAGTRRCSASWVVSSVLRSNCVLRQASQRRRGWSAVD